MDYPWGLEESDTTERLSLHIVPFRNCQSARKKTNQKSNYIDIIIQKNYTKRTYTKMLSFIVRITHDFGFICVLFYMTAFLDFGNK